MVLRIYRLLFPRRPLPDILLIHTRQGGADFFLYVMETKNEIMLDESQHRLLMCMRMAKALDKGEIFLDATGPRMCWRMGKEDGPDVVFRSIGEMEGYLEHLLENRWRLGHAVNADRGMARRMAVINERRKARTNGTAMTFPSCINNQ